MYSTRIKEIARHNSVVASVLMRDGTLEDCIELMHQCHKKDAKELIRLHSICPRKLKIDGKWMVWRCPIELVPEIPNHLKDNIHNEPGEYFELNTKDKIVHFFDKRWPNSQALCGYNYNDTMNRFNEIPTGYSLCTWCKEKGAPTKPEQG